MKSELSVLEGVLEKSGDQTKEELRTLKQMFEQSEQSRNARKFYVMSMTFIIYIHVSVQCIVVIIGGSAMQLLLSYAYCSNRGVA